MKSRRRIRIGLWYAAGAVALALVSVLLAPWGLLLLWPCVSLFVVAGGYLRWGPGVFRKRDGRLGAWPRVIMAPYLGAHWLWRLKDWRRTEPCHQIMPGLRVGRVLTGDEARAQIDDGVVAVLDLTCEHNETEPFRKLEHYRNLQVLDLTLPDVPTLDEGVRFIQKHMQHGEVFLHCAIGYGRGAIMAAAAVMAAQPKLSVDEACDHVKSVRGRAKLSPWVREHLRRYRAHL